MNLEEIKNRNAKVEADKAWETSWTRQLLITLATYLTIMCYLTLLGMERVYLHALVPAMGYFLSTLTLPIFKQYWIDNIYKRSEHGHLIS
jgi:hypothetical protein